TPSPSPGAPLKPQGCGQLRNGEEMVTCVSCSIVENSASEETSKSVSRLNPPSPLTGSIQPKSVAAPTYWIWSHRVVLFWPTDRIIRWPVTCVVSDCGAAQPPHADAS